MDNRLRPGDLVDGLWRVVGKLGEGTYSEIFGGVNIKTGEMVALKTERPNASGVSDVLYYEANVLKRLQRYPYCPRFLRYTEFSRKDIEIQQQQKAMASGNKDDKNDAVLSSSATTAQSFQNQEEVPNTEEGEESNTKPSRQSSKKSRKEEQKVDVIVMQLLGPNLTQVRKQQPGERFRYKTICEIGLQMLGCIEAVHREGLVHRDVKPSNFVIGKGPEGSRIIRLLDYGLCRTYCDKGEIKPARECTEFRGTSMYASLNSHYHMDLGRRDDLWSLFYVLVDLLRGAPWRAFQGKKNGRQESQKCKEYYRENPTELLKPIPRYHHFLKFFRHLMKLRFEQKPNYAFLAQCLKKASQEQVEIPEILDLPIKDTAVNLHFLYDEDFEDENLRTGDPDSVMTNAVSQPELDALSPVPRDYFDLRCSFRMELQKEQVIKCSVTHSPLLFCSDNLLHSRGGSWDNKESGSGVEFASVDTNCDVKLIGVTAMALMDKHKQVFDPLRKKLSENILNSVACTESSSDLYQKLYHSVLEQLPKMEYQDEEELVEYLHVIAKWHAASFLLGSSPYSLEFYLENTQRSPLLNKKKSEVDDSPDNIKDFAKVITKVLDELEPGELAKVIIEGKEYGRRLIEFLSTGLNFCTHFNNDRYVPTEVSNVFHKLEQYLRELTDVILEKNSDFAVTSSRLWSDIKRIDGFVEKWNHLNGTKPPAMELTSFEGEETENTTKIRRRPKLAKLYGPSRACTAPWGTNNVALALGQQWTACDVEENAHQCQQLPNFATPIWCELRQENDKPIVNKEAKIDKVTQLERFVAASETAATESMNLSYSKSASLYEWLFDMQRVPITETFIEHDDDDDGETADIDTDKDVYLSTKCMAETSTPQFGKLTTPYSQAPGAYVGSKTDLSSVNDQPSRPDITRDNRLSGDFPVVSPAQMWNLQHTPGANSIGRSGYDSGHSLYEQAASEGKLGTDTTTPYNNAPISSGSRELREKRSRSPSEEYLGSVNSASKFGEQDYFGEEETPSKRRQSIMVSSDFKIPETWVVQSRTLVTGPPPQVVTPPAPASNNTERAPNSSALIDKQPNYY